MKKVLLFALILGGTVAFTSCGSSECECTVGGETTTYTEDDYEGDIEEGCKAADSYLTDPDKCEMK